MKKIFLSTLIFIFYLTCLPSFGFSQTNISGYAPSFSGKEIQLYTYKDYITKSKVLIGSSPISAEGNFMFTLADNLISKTFYGIFKIGNFASTVFVEPGLDYEISILKPDSVVFSEDKVNYIEPIILKPRNNELNSSLKSFNEKYHHFVKINYVLFRQKSARNAVDSFKVKVQKEYDKNADPYLLTYIKYSLASLDLIATENRHKVYTEYLASMPVEYRNDSYMAFFNEFYYKEFESFSDSHLKEKLLNAVNVQKNYEEVIKVLAKDKLLSNERICEFVLIKGLYENYSDKEFDKKSIRVVLQDLVKKSAIPEHVEIAMNILHETGKLGFGAIAPGFSLYDREQKLVSLSEFKGKYIYLDFWATWCIPCIKEMPHIEELKRKFGKDIVFISISIDKDFASMEKFLKKKKNYDWVFLHYGNNTEIKELYNVLAIPAFFLIDPDGIIVQSPAYRPGKEMEETFYKITSGKKIIKKAYEEW